MGHVVLRGLPDGLLQRTRAIAAQTHRRVEDVLLEWLSRGETDIRRRLDELMRIYGRRMAQQAHVLKEAVDRGLRPPRNYIVVDARWAAHAVQYLPA
jgi:hypothetical protein